MDAGEVVGGAGGTERGAGAGEGTAGGRGGGEGADCRSADRGRRAEGGRAAAAAGDRGEGTGAGAEPGDPASGGTRPDGGPGPGAGAGSPRTGSARRGAAAGAIGEGDGGAGRGAGAAEETAGGGGGGEGGDRQGADGEIAGGGRQDEGGGAGCAGEGAVGSGAAAHRAGFVAIVGLPGAGKSTLLNRLVGESLAIVSPKPQTTRRRILGIARRRGLECILLDTPGIHRPRHGLGKAMMRSVAESLGGADLALAVVDGVRPGSETDLDGLVRRLRRFRGPRVIGINKSDAASRSQVARLTARFREAFAGRGGRSAELAGEEAGGAAIPDAVVPDTEVPDTEVVVFSARTGANVDSPQGHRAGRGEARPDRSLLAVVAARLPFGPPLYEADRITDLPEAFFAAEEVRERMLTHLRQEVPHAAAVRIEEYDDSAPKRGLVRIRASVLVDRDSQRGIVIGRGGGMLKRVGSEARAAIESRLGRRVFLGLQVKVRSGWRDNPGILRDLGL